MNEDNTLAYHNTAVVGNILELMVSAMEIVGGNEVAVKDVSEMANDAAAILNSELGDVK